MHHHLHLGATFAELAEGLGEPGTCLIFDISVVQREFHIWRRDREELGSNRTTLKNLGFNSTDRAKRVQSHVLGIIRGMLAVLGDRQWQLEVLNLSGDRCKADTELAITYLEGREPGRHVLEFPAALDADACHSLQRTVVLTFS